MPTAMRIPPGQNTTQVFSSLTNQNYIPDANGFIVADSRDVPNLLAAGFLPGPKDEVYTADNDNTAHTAAAAAICGGVAMVLNMTGALGAARNLTLPTAALIVAALPGAYVGQTWRVRIINSSGGAFAWTVVTATGLTLNGTMTIAQNTFRDLMFQITALGGSPAITVQSVGTGTQS